MVYLTLFSFWLWLDRISIVLSYFVVISIGAFLLHVLRYRRLRRQIARSAGKTSKPRGLVVSFREPIKVAFQQALQEFYPDINIPVDEYHSQKDATEKDIHKHLDAMRAFKEQYMNQAVTELHLAIKAPLALAVAIGAIFDNWVTVIVYHNNQGKYERWATLGQAKAWPGLDEYLE